jgi:spermidine/putrescine transport system ATP-binding protein
MIAGFIAPDGGDIAIGGKSMRGVAPNRRPVNMVFQQLALFPMMSSARTWPSGWRGAAWRARNGARSHAMLERVGLGGAADKRVDELVGRPASARRHRAQLVLEPTLLLLDEPLGALDLKLREHMKIELKQLQAAFGTTFVYITHDQSEALVLSDHVGVMSHGRFEQLGTPQDLYYRPQTPFVAGFVGANNRIVGAHGHTDGAIVRSPPRTAGSCARAARHHRGGRRRGGIRAPGGGDARAQRGDLPAGQPRHAGRCRACCSTARIRRCCCRKRAPAANFASRCPRPGSSRT